METLWTAITLTQEGPSNSKRLQQYSPLDKMAE